MINQNNHFKPCILGPQIRVNGLTENFLGRFVIHVFFYLWAAQLNNPSRRITLMHLHQSYKQILNSSSKFKRKMILSLLVPKKSGEGVISLLLLSDATN